MSKLENNNSQTRSSKASCTNWSHASQLNAIDDHDSNEKINNRIIILRIEDLAEIDLSTENNDLIIYLENLVNDDKNNIESIQVSEIFSNIVYIKFNNDLNIELIEKNYKKRPILSSKSVTLYRAYETNKGLVFFNSNEELNKSLFKDYMLKNGSLFKLNEHNKLIIFEYSSIRLFNVIYNNLSKEFGQNIKVEHLYNHILLDTFYSKPQFCLNSVDEPMIKEILNDQRKYEILNQQLIDRKTKFSIKNNENNNDEYNLVFEYIGQIPQSDKEYKSLELNWQNEIINFIKDFFHTNLERTKSNFENDFLKIIDQHDLNMNNEKISSFNLSFTITSKDEPKIVAIFLDSNTLNELEKYLIEKCCKLNVKYANGCYEFIIEPNKQINNNNEFRNFNKNLLKSYMDNFIEHYDNQIFEYEIRVFKYEARILLDENFISTLKSRDSKMLILVIPSLECIKLRGTRISIDYAKKLVDEIREKIIHKVFKINLFIHEFIQNNELEFVNLLRSNLTKCQISLNKSNDLVIHSIDSTKIDVCYAMVEKFVLSNKIKCKICQLDIRINQIEHHSKVCANLNIQKEMEEWTKKYKIKCDICLSNVSIDQFNDHGKNCYIKCHKCMAAIKRADYQQHALECWKQVITIQHQCPICGLKVGPDHKCKLCPICLEQKPFPWRIFNCGHSVCVNCYNLLVRDAFNKAQSNGQRHLTTISCPTCRKPNQGDAIQLY